MHLGRSCSIQSTSLLLQYLSIYECRKAMAQLAKAGFFELYIEAQWYKFLSNSTMYNIFPHLLSGHEDGVITEDKNVGLLLVI